MGALAMTHAGYVAAGWAIPLVGLAAYSLRTIRRGRTLAAQVPPEERRWS
jgi:heme exporter protein D